MVERGAAFGELRATFVVNDDVEAAVRLRRRRRPPRPRRRGSRARARGRAAAGALGGERRRGASRRRRGGGYVGAGPVWATPSKADADPPIGLDGLRAICAAVSIPVVAIGGIDASERRAPASRRARPASPSSARPGTRRADRGDGRCGSLTSASSACSPSWSGAGSRASIENDAAVIDGLVVTQDALVEDVHFRLDWISWRDLGFRAAAVNLSDLAASGAEPRGLVVSLGASSGPASGGRARALRGDRGDRCAGRRRRHDPRRQARCSRSPRWAAPTASPGAAGRGPGDVLVVTGPLGGGRSGLPRAAVPCARRCDSPRAGELARAADGAARHLGRARLRRRPHRRPLGRPLRDRARTGARSPRARPSTTSASARTTSCWPRPREPGGLRGDRPLRGGRGRRDPPATARRVDLAGWEHFRLSTYVRSQVMTSYLVRRVAWAGLLFLVDELRHLPDLLRHPDRVVDARPRPGLRVDRPADGDPARGLAACRSTASSSGGSLQGDLGHSYVTRRDGERDPPPGGAGDRVARDRRRDRLDADRDPRRAALGAAAALARSTGRRRVFVLIGISAHPVWIGLILSYVLRPEARPRPERRLLRPGLADDRLRRPAAVGVAHVAAVDHLRADVRGDLHADGAGERARGAGRGLRSHRPREGRVRGAGHARRTCCGTRCCRS